jgi:broad specificity phosphatase PhoE
VIAHLVRHGQSYNTHREPGEPYPANPPLTPIGVRQAERVGARLAGLGIDRLVSSPMLRCVETADFVARATGQRVEVLAVAYEHRQNEGYRCWGSREILARYPDLVIPEDFGPDDWPYGQETLESAVARAEQFRVWLWAQAESGRWRQVAVVIHGAITRLILERMLDLEPLALAALVTDNTSLCSLRLAERRLQVLGSNDVAHLAGDGEVDPLAGLTR